jgi:hypothetical protein
MNECQPNPLGNRGIRLTNHSRTESVNSGKQANQRKRPKTLAQLTPDAVRFPSEVLEDDSRDFGSVNKEPVETASENG